MKKQYKKFNKIALEDMRSGQTSYMRFLWEVRLRCKMNPDKKERKELLNEFWSIVLFESWSVAAEKIEKWYLSHIPGNKHLLWGTPKIK